MPYMKNDTISQSPIGGGIEITDAQYQVVYEAMLEGKPVTVKNNAPFIYSGEKRTVYRLVNNVVESQEIYSEDDTPGGWQDNEPTPETEPKTKFTSLEYLDRFTEAEEDLIIQAADANIQVKKFYNRLLAATFIDLDDPRTAAGIDALIAAGLLEASRKAELLQPE